MTQYSQTQYTETQYTDSVHTDSGLTDSKLSTSWCTRIQTQYQLESALCTMHPVQSARLEHVIGGSRAREEEDREQ
eukprot:2542637-Rhodomonas_salina.1